MRITNVVTSETGRVKVPRTGSSEQAVVAGPDESLPLLIMIRCAQLPSACIRSYAALGLKAT